MPEYLVHQNMRVWNGVNDPRFMAYAGNLLPPNLPHAQPALAGFHGVRATLQSPAAVVGLTEVILGGGVPGNGNAGPVTEPLFAPGGDAGNQVFDIEVGTTSVGGVTEYTSIVVRENIPVLWLGRVCFGGGTYDSPGAIVSQGAEPPEDPDDPIVWQPPGYPGSLDYRAVAYVVIDITANRRIAVGFLHNTYTLESRYSVMQKLPWALEAMARDVHAANLGGDFNAAPHQEQTVHAPRRPAYSYSAVTALGPPPFGPTFPGAHLGGTTWHGNPFDYWLSTVPPATPLVPGGVPTPVAALSTATWTGNQGLMSDHVAITLRVI